MKRRHWIRGATAAAISPAIAEDESRASVEIRLNPDIPSKSVGKVLKGEAHSFPVGLGRNGPLPAGSVFRAGYSLLGEFAINAILTGSSFAMQDSLIKKSGKTRDWLSRHLFSNMNRIDFDGDATGGEYGNAFIGLSPLDSSVRQPFHFGEYKGVFRWYSYAIHGTQDKSRIGKSITGGCINVGKSDLQELVERVSLGDRVVIDA